MIGLRWLVFAVLLFLGGWVVLANWIISFRKGGGSPIPVFGGVLAALALVVVPAGGLGRFWWAPLIADLGCVPYLLLTAGVFLPRWMRMLGGRGPDDP